MQTGSLIWRVRERWLYLRTTARQMIRESTDLRGISGGNRNKEKKNHGRSWVVTVRTKTSETQEESEIYLTQNTITTQLYHQRQYNGARWKCQSYSTENMETRFEGESRLKCLPRLDSVKYNFYQEVHGHTVEPRDMSAPTYEYSEIALRYE